MTPDTDLETLAAEAGWMLDTAPMCAASDRLMRRCLTIEERELLRQRVATTGATPVAASAHVSVATLTRALRGERVCGVTHAALTSA